MPELFQHMADRSNIEHADITRCGHCWQLKIRADVASEFIKAGRISRNDLLDMNKEVDRRWRETDLYKRVREMAKKKLTLDQIQEILGKEGIEI